MCPYFLQRYRGYNLVFSDEKMWRITEHGIRMEWVEKGEHASGRAQDRYATAIHVWGCIGVGIKPPLVWLRGGTLDSNAYIKKVLGPMKKHLEGRILVEDGAAVHKSKTVNEFKDHNHIGYVWNRHLNETAWPPKSADLNPIENIWGILSRQLEAEPRDDDTPEALWKVVQELWRRLPQSVIDNAVRSWERRFEKAIENDGRLVKM
jgi:transposase